MYQLIVLVVLQRSSTMNYSLPASHRVSFPDLPSLDKNTTTYCHVNETQLRKYILAIATSVLSETDTKYKMIADVYVVLTLCIFGFIGNAITVAVLRKDPDRATSPTNWLLQTLALVDTTYLAAR